MTTVYELKTEQFTGPLDKLLELIEGRELVITEISLAVVTDDFLKYVKSLEEVSPALLADFLMIASRLILLKSKALLPELSLTVEEEADIKNLEERLRAYQELRAAKKFLEALWKGHHHQFSRAYFLSGLSSLESAHGLEIFYPGKTLEPARLIAVLEELIQGFQKLALEEQVLREKIVTLEEKIEEIVSRLQNLETTKFHELTHEVSRSEAIVVFLAVLHLARERVISLEQTDHFSDIIIKKVPPAGGKL